MVFSSLPLYLDPPNLNQQEQQQQQQQQHQQIHLLGSSSGGGVGSGDASSHLPPPPGLALAAGSIRPGSMSDRARLAKIPQPEAGLKCPRCYSANTKFCYFNNYSLSQPRHFCKTCRRYWTRGGALRNVPVGGGCRRNKRTKPSSSSTNSANTSTAAAAAAVPSVASSGSSSAATTSAASLHQLPFMASLHQFRDFGGYGAGVQPPANTLDYQLATAAENLRLQQLPQFPLLGEGHLDHALPPPATMPVYPFQGGGGGSFIAGSFAGRVQSSEPSAVKMEDKNDNQQMFHNLARMQYLGLSRNDQLFWNGSGGSGGGGSTSSGGDGGGGWPPDLSGFNNSSLGNLM